MVVSVRDVTRSAVLMRGEAGRETTLSGLRCWVSILASSTWKREPPGRVKVFDPYVNNLSLTLGKRPGQWQALAGLIGRRAGSA